MLLAPVAPSTSGQSASLTHVSSAVWQKYGPVPKQLSSEGEQKPSRPQSESTAQLPPGAQTFALLSVDELRQTHGVRDGQSASLEQSSYEQPPGPTSPANGKQRPFAPLLHCESDKQATPPSTAIPAVAREYGWPTGPGPRCEEQHGEARWFRAMPASSSGGEPASANVGS